MSNPNQAEPTPELKPPKCPHCGQELTGSAVYMWRLEGAMVTCVYCPNDECRTALQFFYFPLARAAAQEPPRIARPS